MSQDNSSIISVILPVYNAESYIAQCLRSLQTQTYRQLQIIVVDDGSTDSSVELVQNIALTDTRISLIKQEHKGQSAARNEGLKHASGQYVAFLDADDWLDEDFFETMLGNINYCDVVQCGYKRVLDDGTVLKRVFPCHFYRLISACMRLYRRTAVEGLLFEVGQYYEDALFSLDLWLRSPKHKVLRYAGYNYRLNLQSTTSRLHNAHKQRLFFLLRKRKEQASLRNRLIIAYTAIRLRLHFIFEQH